MSEHTDLVIVGGGISGASLLYAVAKFTDVDDVTLIEKEREIAAVNSHRTNNSQTLHFGDIETNYTLEKAEEVKEGAELLAGYLEGTDPDREMHSKRSKMVLGVGDEEVAKLEERYRENGFGDLFPKLREIGREEIAELEPKVVEGRDPDTELKALQTPDGTSSTTARSRSRSSTTPGRRTASPSTSAPRSRTSTRGATGSRSRPTTATSRPTRSSSPPARTASSSPRRWGTARTCRCCRSRAASSSPTTC